MPPEPKVISLTSAEVHTVMFCLSYRFAALTATDMDRDKALAEMDTIDDVIEKLREK